MKNMKLGSKPDTFQSTNDYITLVAAELASDLVIEVENTKFQLHKFPLLSKCGRLQRLVAEVREDIVKLPEIPGGVETFELCAKFCYGISIILNAYNVISVRCAAEYLGMTEIVENGNLIFKVEVFLNSNVFTSWKDSIIALNTTKTTVPWSEDLKLVSRCIDAVSSKASVDPSTVNWSFTYTGSSKQNEMSVFQRESAPGIRVGNCRNTVIPTAWWVEDIRDLEIDLYGRVMVAIKSKGRMSPELIGEALRVYAGRWLSGIPKDHRTVETVVRQENGRSNVYVVTEAKHKLLLERIVSLLPTEKGSCSCSFLSRLLKAACIVGADTSSKTELIRRVGRQLDEASVKDLLIPLISDTDDSLYDVELVQRIVDQFLMLHHSLPCSRERESQTFYENRRSPSADKLDLKDNLTHSRGSSLLRVAKLIDRYLAEVARDKNLPLTNFIALAESIPSFARPTNDGLYRAIDIYLKEHPALAKSDRKTICRRMDCKKLSVNACMHAAQNERLPLRVVVQVLFFIQVRTTGLPFNVVASSRQAALSAQDKTGPEHGGDGSIQLELAGGKERESFQQEKHKPLLAVSNILKENNTQEEMEMDQRSMQQARSRNLVCSSKGILGRLLSIRNSSSSGSKDSDDSKSSETSGSSVETEVGKEAGGVSLA